MHHFSIVTFGFGAYFREFFFPLQGTYWLHLKATVNYRRKCVFLKCSQIMRCLALLAYAVYFWSSAFLEIQPIVFWCINTCLIALHPHLPVWWIECMAAVPRGHPEKKMLQLMSLSKCIKLKISHKCTENEFFKFLVSKEILICNNICHIGETS